MDDTQLLQQIKKLVEEEHVLLEQHISAGDLDENQHARMKALEVQLDQCWDLLRQRRARRHAGLNPDDAQERPADIVENYKQ